MACYISSRENRFYTALEQLYGFAALVTEANRFPAVKLGARQQLQRVNRRDKTGSRTFGGLPYGIRKETNFDVTTYLTSWAAASEQPSYGPLFQAALGGEPLIFRGGTVESFSGRQLRLSGPHGLVSGQAISCGGELRFVTAVEDAQTVILSAPFTNDQQSGWPVDPAVTYVPATELPSVSIYDCWSPEDAVQRILTGAAVDRLKIEINGDFHEFTFSGVAQDLIDSTSFIAGQAGLPEFPLEPATSAFDYSVVPGNLGQAWLGNNPDQFFTLTSAEVVLDNDLDTRAREFGAEGPQCIVGGMRGVFLDFSVFERPNAETKGLYQAGRQRSPVSVMFQLGQQTSQLCGVYMPGMVPEVPEFDDDETRLEWHFRSCRAQGAVDDEIFIAFG